MKVTVNEAEGKKEEIKYPVLMQYVGCTTKLVVLFTGETEGVTVVSGHGYAVGHASDQFESSKDTEAWKKFTGTITLEND